MKTLTNRIALIAAGAVVLGTLAYGQTPLVKADIPFAFHTANAKLPAGEYVVSQSHTAGGANITVLRNSLSRRAVVALGSPADYNSTGAPAITFQCGADDCALRSIRTSSGTISYNVSHNKSRDKEVAVIIVPLHVTTGD